MTAWFWLAYSCKNYRLEANFSEETRDGVACAVVVPMHDD